MRTTPSSSSIWRFSSLRALVCGLLAASGSVLQAASGSWTGLGSTNLWAVSNNWSTASVPGGSETATFNGAGNGRTTVDMKDGAGNPVVMGNIVFDSANAAAYTFQSTGTLPRFFTSAGTAGITVNGNVVNPQNFISRITVNGSLTLTNHSTVPGTTLNLSGVVDMGGASGLRTLTLDGGNMGTNTISGMLADDSGRRLGVVKNGVGTWVLSGANTYAGETAINQGLLLINNTGGSGTGPGAVTVNNGGILGGGDQTLTKGTLTGAVTVNDGGGIAPGTPGVNNGIGRLNLGTTSFADGGSVFQWNVGSAEGNGFNSPGVAWDHLNIAGDLNIGTTQMLTISIDGSVSGYSVGTPVSYTIATFSGIQTGIPFNGDAFTLNTGSFTPDAGFRADSWSVGLNGKNVVLTYTPTSIPEPSAPNLLAFVFTGLLTVRRRPVGRTP